MGEDWSVKAWEHLTDKDSWFLNKNDKMLFSGARASGKSSTILTTAALKEAYHAMTDLIDPVLSQNTSVDNAVDQQIAKIKAKREGAGSELNPPSQLSPSPKYIMKAKDWRMTYGTTAA